MSDASNYWERPQEHTMVKSQIVFEYFQAWASILARRGQRLMYLDLFAGRGEYDNGELSTALRIVKFVNSDKLLQKQLLIVLNDKSKTHCDNINTIISKHALCKNLHFDPVVTNFEVNAITPDLVDKIKNLPTFCFIDPYGFKGLTHRLVESVIKDWGCECMIFFNTSDINRNLNVDQSQEHLLNVFGKEIYDDLINRVTKYQGKREELILTCYKNSCIAAGAKHFLKFEINCPSKRFHLIYLTKNDLGFNKMKKVMARYSRKEESGIPLYSYIEGYSEVGKQLSLDLSLPTSMLKLKGILLSEFADRKIMVRNIIRACDDKGLFYTEKNIKDALDQLDNEGEIEDITSGARKRQKGTFGDKRIIRFP